MYLYLSLIIQSLLEYLLQLTYDVLAVIRIHTHNLIPVLSWSAEVFLARRRPVDFLREPSIVVCIYLRYIGLVILERPRVHWAISCIAVIDNGVASSRSANGIEVPALDVSIACLELKNLGNH